MNITFSPMWHSLLADLVVAVHVAYVAYIIVGLALIPVGAWETVVVRC